MFNHRNDDTAGHAGRLYDRVHAHFTNRPIYSDVPQVGPGEDFVTATEKAITDCGALIVIVGPDWLTSLDRNGRRLSDAEDITRLQIAFALARGAWVVPALVKGATVPPADALPADIGALSRRQGAELRDTRWESDVDDLIAAIEKSLALAEGNPAASGGRSRSHIRRAAIAAVVAGSVIGPIAVLQPSWFTDLGWQNNALPTVAHGTADLTLAGYSGLARIAALPGGKIVAGPSRDDSVLLWNLATGESEAIFKEYGLAAIAPVSDGRLAFGYWGEVRIWDMASRRVADALVLPRDIRLDRTDESIGSLTVLPDGRLVSQSYYGPAIWDFKTHNAKQLYEHPIGKTCAALLLPDGRFAFALCNGGIKLWNPKTDRVEVTLKGRGDRTTALVATPDGRLVSGAQNGIVELWDLDIATARLLAGSVGRSGAPADVVIGPNVALGKDVEVRGNVVIGRWSETRLALLNSSKLFALGDEAIAVFDLSDGKAERVVGIEGRWSADPVMLADGRLALGAEDGTISIWNPNTGTADLILEGHAGPVTTAILLPDSRLASGSKDGTIKIWSVTRHDAVRR